MAGDMAVPAFKRGVIARHMHGIVPLNVIMVDRVLLIVKGLPLTELISSLSLIIDPSVPLVLAQHLVRLHLIRQLS